MNNQSPKWLEWAREIFSLSQSGITYSRNQYDIERYKRLQEITAEMIAAQSEIEKESVLESFSMQSGYITPKIDVRGAVIRDDKILLIQERADAKWAMPGGWADLGNSPASVAEREVFERGKVLGIAYQGKTADRGIRDDRRAGVEFEPFGNIRRRRHPLVEPDRRIMVEQGQRDGCGATHHRTGRTGDRRDALNAAGTRHRIHDGPEGRLR